MHKKNIQILKGKQQSRFLSLVLQSDECKILEEIKLFLLKHNRFMDVYIKWNDNLLALHPQSTYSKDIRRVGVFL